MEYIKVTSENIEKEHICCAISNNNDIQVSSKKAWLSERFGDGLVFLKSTERGKCFIEYIPAEKAWNPISADGYMYIDCLWVAGSFKGHGYSSDLLNACIEDSKNKGKKGLCILAAAKKKNLVFNYGIYRLSKMQHYHNSKNVRNIPTLTKWAMFYIIQVNARLVRSMSL